MSVGTLHTYKITIYCPTNTSAETRRNWLQDKPLIHRDRHLITSCALDALDRWIEV
jgi:hypothetical protein